MKGQWKTLEAIFAGLVILTLLAALSSTHSAYISSPPRQAHAALEAVYEGGSLRTYASQMNLSAIESEVAGTGQLFGFNHSVSICNETACKGNAPDKTDVWTAGVILSGDEQYNPVEVILYVFRN
jgi:hypothetical protein